MYSFDINGLFGVYLDANRNAYSWGANQVGQLGLGDCQSRAKPQLIASIQNEEIETVRCGVDFAIAIVAFRQHANNMKLSSQQFNIN